MSTEKQAKAHKAASTDTPMTEAQRAKLRAALKSRRESGYALAATINVAQSRISRWLNGKGQPSMTAGYLIERHLDLPPGWLTSPGNEPEPEYRTEDDRLLLALCRDLGLTPREAMRRLAASMAAPAPTVDVPEPPGAPAESPGEPEVRLIRKVRRKMPPG